RVIAGVGLVKEPRTEARSERLGQARPPRRPGDKRKPARDIADAVGTHEVRVAGHRRRTLQFSDQNSGRTKLSGQAEPPLAAEMSMSPGFRGRNSGTVPLFALQP